MAEKYSFRARTRARQRAVQGLYQHHISGGSGETIYAEFTSDPKILKDTDTAYFERLLLNTIHEQAALNECFASYLDRPLEAVDPVELSVLQLGSYELRYQTDTPWKVVVSEAVDLARRFGGADDSYAYINGVLDKVARSLRAEECSAESPKQDRP